MRPYNIDFTRIARWLLPAGLRKPGLSSLLDAMLTPLVALHLRFLAYREEVIVELDSTSQVCRLKNVLNDAYDPTLRRVQVIDGPDRNPLYLHLQAEKKPVFLYASPQRQFIYTVPETIAGADFIVRLPAGYNPETARALVNRQRLASKNAFLIEAL